MRASLPLCLLALARASQVPVPPTCAPNCIPALAAAIAQCQALPPPCTVQLSLGTYPLQVPYGGTALALGEPLVNFTLAGQGDGTLLLLSDIANLFTISGGTGVTLASFAVDSARVPFTLGLATADTPAGTLLDIEGAAGLYPIDLARFPWLARAQSVLGYDAALQRPAAPPNVTDIYVLDAPIALTYTGAASSAPRVRLEGRHLPLGRLYILRHQVYSFNAFTFSGTQGLALRSVSLFSMAGMGLLTDGATGITVDGLSIRKLPGRPMSICADGMHLSNTRGGDVLVQNCLLEGQGDDGLNIPTIFQQIGAVGASGQSFQVQARNQPCPTRPLLAVGDTALFYNISSMALLGQGVVAAIGANYTVTLAAPPPPGVGLYTLLINAAMQAGSVVLRNNTFRNNRARGALLKSSNVLATGNVFEGMSLSAVKTETDGCYWDEGHPVSNPAPPPPLNHTPNARAHYSLFNLPFASWTVVGNTFKQCNYWSPGGAGDIEVDNAVPSMKGGVPNPQACHPWTTPTTFVQHSLNISYNTFHSPYGAPAALVQSTDGLTVVGNAVMRDGGARALSFDFVGQGTAHSVVEGNTCDGGPCTQSGFY